MLTGQIHSFESMGLVDGPGIRAVVFLQGCALRCRFCHNPDTWPLQGGTAVTPEELVRRIARGRPYYSGGGGVTFSGGEPLLQPEFLAETLRLCHAAGIHTCIDTAGCGAGHYAEILAHTDLVLYDVKQITAEGYRALTGTDWAETNRFLAAVRTAGTPVWVRHVVVPGMSDSDAFLLRLRAFVESNVPNVQRVELLPYHLLGAAKYAALGIPYPLAGVSAMDKARTSAWQDRYFTR